VKPSDLGIKVGSDDEWRPSQLEVAQAIADSPSKFVWVDGQTGVGKSVVALATYGLLEVPTVILTADYGLQRQYSAASDGFVAYGRPAFKCKLDGYDHLRVSQAPCAGGYECKQISGCDYFIQREALRHQPLTLTNYAYYIYEKRAGGFAPPPTLLICDEAHVLESFLVGSATLDLSKLSTFGEPPNTDEELRTWLRQVALHLEHQISSFSADDPDAFLDDTAPKLLRRLRDDCVRVAWSKGWIRQNNLVRPIWAHEQFDAMIQGTTKIVIMSATPPPASVLGDLEDIDYIDIPMDFDRKEQAPIYYRPAAKLNYKNIKEEFPKVVSAVDAIISQHPLERGLIHTHKFELSRQLVNSSRYAHEMVTHRPGGKNRLAALRSFKRGDRRIMVSPSATSGVDLPGDECRFIIWVKAPYPDLGDAVVAARFKDNRNWYEEQTVITLAQGLGRGMRSMDDHCDGYILDGSAGRLLRRLPTWLRDTVVWEVSHEHDTGGSSGLVDQNEHQP
jgi:Rad3-related DNA helicase